MKTPKMVEAMSYIDDDLVSGAITYTKKKKGGWLRWGAMAACLCLVVVGAVHMMAPGTGNKAVLQWSDSFSAKDYFKYNSGSGDVVSTSDSLADAELDFAAEQYFSDYREQMEADGVIPAMPSHPLYHCTARYNEDGSIFSITHYWHLRGDTYSTLSITMGQDEVTQITDCICVEIDADGNIVPPAVTVTERDGVQIVAEGREDQNKTVTFQNDTAWYQISGSWGDSYEAVIELLDWVWEHPVDFERFSMDKGVEITHSTLAEHPDAFAAQLPDFETLGYFLGENYLQLKDGVPYTFEGHYYTGVGAEKVQDGSYLEESGWTEIHWCINTQPDYYDLQDCMGDRSELTQEKVTEALTTSGRFSFMMNDVFIRVYCKDATEAWKAVETLKY